MHGPFGQNVDKHSTPALGFRGVVDSFYPMRVVVARTGLSAHVIRVWERRYKAVVPRRSETNRRLYSDRDIDRLRLLARVVEGGHAISQIARLPDEQLRKMTASFPPSHSAPDSESGAVQEIDRYVQEAIDASRSLDASALDDVLGRAGVEFGRHVLVTHVIPRLLERLGTLWSRGLLRVSQEHLASGVVRKALDQILSDGPPSGSSPTIVLATLPGQVHELGCLIAAATAVMQGWRTVYLGLNLPAEEVVAAALDSGARAIGLSFVFPSANAQSLSELRRMRSLLPKEIAVLIGGRVAPSYQVSESEGIEAIESIDAFRQRLLELSG